MRPSAGSGTRSRDEGREPVYADFLAYALTKILGIVDVLDLARSHHVLGAAFVRQAAWPASTLLAGFKLFFTMVLLAQIFASLRQGKLLAETITDFWSPHEPIHERARNALPTYGTLAIGPLLGSLRSVPSLTKEQRDQLPLILETIGPSIIPALVRHLHDPHEHVRAIVAAALGKLHDPGDGPLGGRTRPGPQRRGTAERGRSPGEPREHRAGARTHEARPRPGPWLERAWGCVARRVEEACRTGTAHRPGRSGRCDAGVCPGG